MTAIGRTRTTHVSPSADKTEVSEYMFDAMGRQLTIMSARELLATAYLSLSNGTETTLLAGTAGQFLDLVSITCSNTSTAALGAGTSTQVDLRPQTAGAIAVSISVPDADTKTTTFNPPLPMNELGGTWTAQMADLTGTTLLISALFVKNR